MSEVTTSPKPKINPNWKPLIKLLNEGMTGMMKEGYPGKDFESDVFEQAMECLYGKKVWDWWNRNYKG